MIFRQLFDPDSSTYTYLIADELTKEAVLVDSVIERVERDYELLRELNLTLKYCLETHVHADHITGVGRLQELTGCLIVFGERASNPYAEIRLKDGDILEIGNIKIKALTTPGHTNCSVCYVVNNLVLTGDTLLIRGCGRTDFQSGSSEQLYDSVTQKLFTLSDSVFVYPGHDYNGRTVSTIGEEKKWNRRLSNKSKNQFIEIMNNLNLPHPKKIMDSVPANERSGLNIVVNGWKKIDPQITVGGQVTLSELKQLANDGFRSVLSVRSPQEQDFLIEEETQVKSLGLEYYNVPLTISNLNFEYCDRALNFLNNCPKPVLVHCGIGLRASAIALMYLAIDRNLSAKQAFAIAEEKKLNCFTSPKIKTFFEKYLIKG